MDGSAQSSGMSELFVGMGVSVGAGVNVGAKLSRLNTSSAFNKSQAPPASRKFLRSGGRVIIHPHY